MKTKIIIKILIFGLAVLIFSSSCTTPSGTHEDQIPVTSGSAQSLKETGKIYVKDNFLFVNELSKGVHVINNEDPFKPEIIAFLNIPGNVDIAIRDNVLYADSHNDLVVLDISDPVNVWEIRRIENIFPEAPRTPILLKILFIFIFLLAQPSQAESSESTSTGEGGSLARFTIVDDYLYTLSNSALQLFDIKNPSNPTVWKKIEIGWDIETIFPYEDKLFIGGQTGMYIYDNNNPAEPVLISRFAHITSCDPVVVEGNYAYVTLRGGTNCGGREDLLEIIDISDIKNPVLAVAYPMDGPFGLGIDRGILFICDGEGGLKLFDASDVLNLNLITIIDDIFPYDVILSDKRALVVEKYGLNQYDYQKIEDVRLISRIPNVNAGY